MIRKQEATGKTVDEARAKACALLGVQADDLNVSYEVLEMPQKTGFLGLKTTPAKVCVSVAVSCTGSSRCPRGRACRTGGSTGCRG